MRLPRENGLLVAFSEAFDAPQQDREATCLKNLSPAPSSPDFRYTIAGSAAERPKSEETREFGSKSASEAGVLVKACWELRSARYAG